MRTPDDLLVLSALVFECPAMMVALRETTVSKLMVLRNTPNECISDVVDRMLIATTPANSASPTIEVGLQTSTARQGKYACDVLGTRLHTSTLGSLFGEVIDLVDVIAPDALLRLSEKRTTKRRHLSRDRTGVHLGTQNLPVLQTRSGWWISKNVSQTQTISHLRALCTVARLEYGKDVRFPVK